MTRRHPLVRPTQRGRRWFAAGALAVTFTVAACSDDDTPSDSTVPPTLADEEVVDQPPGAPNDVSDGSGEGGDRSD